eukprot:CAMPEP_0184090606 /NCGR_PEP_ID=MMETSP0974-20121125/7315_1 /TAXON_ID=483370 /ORGANISM="non described non described, Strain CCMP2097" /LENGTH=163 /DNA_ID=CAMNT_0026393331 /DNA_START=57 /DNA_END=544 /DNA_ORIENTATION=+
MASGNDEDKDDDDSSVSSEEDVALKEERRDKYARPSAYSVQAAHREMGCPFTPTKSPIIQTVLKRIEHKDDPKGGPSFDPAVDLLPMIYGLIRQEGRMLLKRVQDCAMLVLHFYLMARTSDMTNFSFAVEDMKWPMKDSRYFCLDGQPLHPLSFTVALPPDRR